MFASLLPFLLLSSTHMCTPSLSHFPSFQSFAIYKYGTFLAYYTLLFFPYRLLSHS